MFLRFVKKELGWKEINEEFTRMGIESRWGNIYIHRMVAPIKHEHYHDHPWNFISFIIWGGYVESFEGANHIRRPGTILFRRATDRHITTTYNRHSLLFGSNNVSWSIIFTGPKIREWRGNLSAT